MNGLLHRAGCPGAWPRHRPARRASPARPAPACTACRAQP